MPRIPVIPVRTSGFQTKIVHFFTRRSMKQMTGRTPERMMEPLERYAHVPALLSGYASLETATAKVKLVDERLRYLAELKAATITNCEYCIDLGSQVARQSGLTDAHLLALAHYQDSDLFTPLEKLVIEYAVGMSRAPIDVPDALFDRLRQHFNAAQIVSLTHVIALENMRGRFNLALGIGAAGFSEGMVCALPVAAVKVHA